MLLGVLKKKLLKILKLTFTGAVVNEASTASNTRIDLDASVNLAGNKLNLNGSADCSVKISQLVGSDWFNLQRDFDLKFDLVIASNTTSGKVFTFLSNSGGNSFQLEYATAASGFPELRLWRGSSPFQFASLSPSYGVVPKNTTLNCTLEYRKTSAKFYINNILAIDMATLTQPVNNVYNFWLGGDGAENTIVGSLDNVEMTLL